MSINTAIVGLIAPGEKAGPGETGAQTFLRPTVCRKLYAPDIIQTSPTVPSMSRQW